MLDQCSWMLIAIKIIDHDQKFNSIMHSLTYLALPVLNSVHTESDDITELSAYEHD